MAKILDSGPARSFADLIRAAKSGRDVTIGGGGFDTPRRDASWFGSGKAPATPSAHVAGSREALDGRFSKGWGDAVKLSKKDFDREYLASLVAGPEDTFIKREWLDGPFTSASTTSTAAATGPARTSKEIFDSMASMMKELGIDKTTRRSTMDGTLDFDSYRDVDIGVHLDAMKASLAALKKQFGRGIVDSDSTMTLEAKLVNALTRAGPMSVGLLVEEAVETWDADDHAALVKSIATGTPLTMTIGATKSLPKPRKGAAIEQDLDALALELDSKRIERTQALPAQTQLEQEQDLAALIADPEYGSM